MQRNLVGTVGADKPEEHPTVGWGHYQDTEKKRADFEEIFGKEGASEDFARRYLVGDIVAKKQKAGVLFDRTAKRLKLKGRWADVDEDWLKNVFTDKLFVGTYNAEIDKGWQALVRGALETDPAKRADLIMEGAQQPGSRGWRNRAKLRRQTLIPKEILDLYRPHTLTYDAPFRKAAHTRKVKVRKGQNLTLIAREWGLGKGGVDKIVKWNKLPNANKITVGDELIIKVPAWIGK